MWRYRCKVPAHPRRMNQAKYTRLYTTYVKILINLHVYQCKTTHTATVCLAKLLYTSGRLKSCANALALTLRSSQTAAPKIQPSPRTRLARSQQLPQSGSRDLQSSAGDLRVHGFPSGVDLNTFAQLRKLCLVSLIGAPPSPLRSANSTDPRSKSWKWIGYRSSRDSVRERKNKSGNWELFLFQQEVDNAICMNK